MLPLVNIVSMKNIILSIVIVLLVGTGIWYFSKSDTINKPILSSEANTNSKIVEEITKATSSASSTIKTTEQSINKEVNNKKYMNAILHTSMGDVTIKFGPETAPNTVANFIKLADSGFYDGTKFHRVIKGFMNQGGDPLSKDDSMMTNWGTGGPGYQFADEITSSNNNKVGSISMANSGPNTNGSQFFINVADNSFLNTKHTVFGQVTAGIDVVMAINNVRTVSGDRPATPVVIKSITLK